MVELGALTALDLDLAGSMAHKETPGALMALDGGFIYQCEPGVPQ